MRPKAIVTFEWLFAASVILSLLNIFVFARGEGSGGVVEAAGAGLTLVVALIASRMRNNIARWVLTVWTLLGVFAIGYVLATEGLAGAGGIGGLAITAVQIAAIAQLFRPEAKAWFARREVVAGG